MIQRFTRTSLFSILAAMSLSPLAQAKDLTCKDENNYRVQLGENGFYLYEADDEGRFSKTPSAKIEGPLVCSFGSENTEVIECTDKALSPSFKLWTVKRQEVSIDSEKKEDTEHSVLFFTTNTQVIKKLGISNKAALATFFTDPEDSSTSCTLK